MLLFRRKARYTDGEIDLIPEHLGPCEADLGFGEEFDFIIVPHGERKEAGEISVRLGESEGIYYYGHIGYHIDPPYRGHGWAEKACRLILPLLRERGKDSVVITCDPDNMASRRTCEKLGCRLERTVPVVGWMRKKYDISAVKCRYIWETDKKEASGWKA